jgi:hypothetical protein
MQPVLYLPAGQTRIAAIQGKTVGRAPRRLLTIQCLGQNTSHIFKFFHLVAGEKISMPQPPAFKAALQQRHHMLLSWKIAESHGVLTQMAEAGRA